MTAMVAEHPIRIGSGVWLDETGEQECCNHDTVARELTLKVSYLAPALRPLRLFRVIDASQAGANPPRGELDFSAPSRPIPGELPVLSMSLTPDFGVANFARFVAALRSLSTTTPQRWQMYSRSDRESLDFTSPHSEHVFDDGNHLSATMTSPPFHWVCR